VAGLFFKLSFRAFKRLFEKASLAPEAHEEGSQTFHVWNRTVKI
jgi:hypothetical protein